MSQQQEDSDTISSSHHTTPSIPIPGSSRSVNNSQYLSVDSGLGSDISVSRDINNDVGGEIKDFDVDDESKVAKGQAKRKISSTAAGKKKAVQASKSRKRTVMYRDDFEEEEEEEE